MAGSQKGKKLTAAQTAQLTKARAKAMVAHPAGAQTTKQLAAERANLVLARAAQATKGRTQSPAMLAAERTNLVKARSAAHAKHPRGHQTPKQLASERANLAKARLKRHNSHHGRRGGGRGAHNYAPLGTHKISFNGSYKLTIRMPTGVNHKFVQRLAPTGYMTRTAWHSSRTHHFQKRLHMRRHRVPGVKHWHRRRGRLTPR